MATTNIQARQSVSRGFFFFFFHLLQRDVQVLLVLGWSSEQENLAGVLQQRDDAEEDERGDEERADGVGDQPAELADEDGGDDDAHAAQRVGQHVQENTWWGNKGAT